ncbi:MAG: TlpA disulfide reductase family protein [Candidatus Glassbacteria bacterium]
MELPYLQEIYYDLKDDGFTVVALETRGDRARAEKFIADKGITFTTLYDEAGSIARDLYGVYAFPTTFLIDRKGVIRYRHIGFKREMEENFRDEIARLLG